jgi:hypothetical protein
MRYFVEVADPMRPEVTAGVPGLVNSTYELAISSNGDAIHTVP